MAEDVPGPSGRVVVVDDDAFFSESLARNLEDAGFRTMCFPDGPSALAHFDAGGAADLVLLDWKMPGMNGIEMLRRLREGGHRLPVIFLTVLSEQIYEEAALGGGAVDFVEKSRSFSILLRRIRLILEGAKGPPADGAASRTSAGALEMDERTARAAWKGRPLDFSLTEFRMVHYLATRPGRDVRYRELYDLVRGEGFAAGHGESGYRANVRAFIKRIRQKFRDIDPDFERIENYPGFGYRWRADV